MALDPNRLYTLLLNTGLQTKDNRLYQVIHDLIGAVSSVVPTTSSSSSGGGGTGPQGPQGIAGLSGLDAIDGLDGIDGIPGAVGLQGISGISGTDGIDGVDGLDGTQGIQGIPGLQGFPGIQGLDGDVSDDIHIHIISPQDFPDSPTFRGIVTALISLVAINNVQAGAAFYLTWNGRAALSSPADGQMNILKQSTTIGVGLDVTTDSILKIRTRAQNADADITAGAITGSANVTGSNLISVNSIQAGSAGQVNFGGSKSSITAPADGQLNFDQINLATGVGIDVLTDAILKIRTRAQTGYATVDALGYKVSGTALAATNLSDYAQGTWTPIDSSGASLVFVSATGTHIRIGKLIFVAFAITYPITVSAAAVTIGGLPFTVGTLHGALPVSFSQYSTPAGYSFLAAAGTSTILAYTLQGNAIINSAFSNLTVEASGCYIST